MKSGSKQQRRFSTAFKKEKVSLIELGKLSVKEVTAIYEVSNTAVYKWLRKYGTSSSTEHIVVEKISEEKKNIELKKQVGELEQTLGRKQLELDYYKSIVEAISEEQGLDLKKKHRR